MRLIEHVREHHIRKRAVALSEQLPCPVDWSLTHAPTVVAARRLARAPEAIVAFGIVERVHIEHDKQPSGRQTTDQVVQCS